MTEGCTEAETTLGVVGVYMNEEGETAECIAIKPYAQWFYNLQDIA
jgi:hypothetical protein